MFGEISLRGADIVERRVFNESWGGLVVGGLGPSLVGLTVESWSSVLLDAFVLRRLESCR